MREHKFRYLVVNRERTREFNETLGSPLKTAGGDELSIYSNLSEDGAENR
jgi:hypothetical protein